jgi:hypothetical protein
MIIRTAISGVAKGGVELLQVGYTNCEVLVEIGRTGYGGGVVQCCVGAAALTVG